MRLVKWISKCTQLHCYDQSISSAEEMQSHLQWQAGESKGPSGLCQVSMKYNENDETEYESFKSKTILRTE